MPVSVCPGSDTVRQLMPLIREYWRARYGHTVRRSRRIWVTPGNCNSTLSSVELPPEASLDRLVTT
jgi:hypothetical protein